MRTKHTFIINNNFIISIKEIQTPKLLINTQKFKQMIPKLISKSRTTEVNTVSDNLIMAYKKQVWENDAYLVSTFGKLQTESDLLRTAINRSRAESILDTKDVIRDEKVKALNYLLLGSIHHPSAIIKSSGEKLSAEFTKYGLKMIHESYAIESSLIESLLQDFSAPELKPDIKAISGCAEVIDELRAAQDDFKTANFTWEEEKAKDGLTESATKIKKEVLSIINDKIVVYLKAMELANQEVYGELAQTISQIIGGMNEAVKRRAKKEEEVAIEN